MPVGNTSQPALGAQFGYTYDSIGNRTSTTVNGRSANYTANTLNQYTSRDVPGAIDVRGEAATTATVTVNQQPTARQGKTFYKAHPVANTDEPFAGWDCYCCKRPSGYARARTWAHGWLAYQRPVYNAGGFAEPTRQSRSAEFDECYGDYS